MNSTETRIAVTAYWNRHAPHFNGSASHVRHESEWQDVMAAAFGVGGSRDVVDLGRGTGACALIAVALGHRARAYDSSLLMLEVARESWQHLFSVPPFFVLSSTKQRRPFADDRNFDTVRR